MLRSLSKDQRRILIVLTLINLFNYLDRQIIFPLFGTLKQEFGVSDFQLGLLGSVFMIVHSLASLPLGLLADKYSRKAIISMGIGFWSIVTFASGMVHSFKGLLGVRSLVGIGEASYAPAATALISDHFPQNVRAQAQGVFNAGMFVGGTLGAMIGGILIYYFHNWRIAFILVAIPGLILAWLASRLPEAEFTEEEHLEPIKALLKNPAYLWILASGVLLTFTVGGYIAWAIEFVTRYKGFDLKTGSIYLGLDMMAAGVIGVFLGSYIADKLQEKVAYGRSLIIAVSLIAATPFMLLGLSDKGHHEMFFVYFFIGTVLLSFYHGPATALIHDIIPKRMRATAFAFYILVIHLGGDTPAPAVIGAISDHYNLRVALQFSTLFVVLGGLMFVPICNLIREKKVHIYAE